MTIQSHNRGPSATVDPLARVGYSNILLSRIYEQDFLPLLKRGAPLTERTIRARATQCDPTAPWWDTVARLLPEAERSGEGLFSSFHMNGTIVVLGLSYSDIDYVVDIVIKSLRAYGFLEDEDDSVSANVAIKKPVASAPSSFEEAAMLLLGGEEDGSEQAFDLYGGAHR